MIILNELDYAELVLRDKTFEGKPYQTLMILAKYYCHRFGYSQEKIVDLLCEFMEQAYPRYSEDKKGWKATIEKIALSSKKYKIHEIEGVWITRSELDMIEGIHDKVLERLMFTILCLAKLAMRKNVQSSGWVNEETKNIFSLARISCSSGDRNKKIGMLAKLGLVEFPKRTDSLSIRVTFIDDESEGILFIRDFRELGYEYMKYKGGNFIRCSECGILTRGNKNGTKRYCSSCIAYTPQPKKEIVCIDCGKTFSVGGSNKRTIRCEECQYEHKKACDRERKMIKK